MQIIYINLDRHHERRARMETLLQGLPHQRLAAVDGKTLASFDQAGQPATSSPLSPFELACLHSHQQAAQLLLNSGAEYVCILEDDVHLGTNFAEFMSDESWIPSLAHVVKLETMFQNLRLGQPVAARDRQLHSLDSRHHGTAGYILSRLGAQQLIMKTQNPQLPLDHILFPDIAEQRSILQISPALVVQDDVLARHLHNPAQIISSIQRAKVKRSMGATLLREASRIAQHIRVALHRARTGIYTMSSAKKVDFE